MHSSTTRRTFLKTASWGALAQLAGVSPASVYFSPRSKLRGRLQSARLCLPARGERLKQHDRSP